MAVLTGWINVLILLIILSPFFLRRAAKIVPENLKPPLMKIAVFTRKLHPILPFFLIIGAGIHARLMLGDAVILHSGQIVFATFIVAIIFALLKKFIAPRLWIKTHRTIAFTASVFVMIHISYPSILSTF